MTLRCRLLGHNWQQEGWETIGGEYELGTEDGPFKVDYRVPVAIKYVCIRCGEEDKLEVQENICAVESTDT